MRINEQARRERAFCQDLIDRLGLDMTLAGFERLFGGERVAVDFLAECRIDFRELDAQLAAEFQTRVEMRQIGVVATEAEAAGRLWRLRQGDRPNSHLIDIPPVSMRMARLQRTTLDPTRYRAAAAG